MSWEQMYRKFFAKGYFRARQGRRRDGSGNIETISRKGISQKIRVCLRSLLTISDERNNQTKTGSHFEVTACDCFTIPGFL